jgi:hypothetical protein
VVLPDGSMIYSAETIAKQNLLEIPLGGKVYQTEGELVQPFAVDSYRTFLRWIRAQGVEPVLLMTPYHQNVWKSRAAPTTQALIAVEPMVRNRPADPH